MGNTQSAPNSIELKTQSSLFDLDSMEDVLLFKTGTFTPISTPQEALARVGGSSDKLVEIINRGLKSHETQELKDNTSIPWMVQDEDENLVPFTGTPADGLKVNTLILNLAKSVFGYAKGLKPEDKKAKKAAAIEMIKNTPAIREGLKVNAALTPGADSE